MGSAWSPQLGPQSAAIRAKRTVQELFYGGAAGGGKSDFLLGDFAQDVQEYGSAWRGILFRRHYPELDDLVRRSLELYPAMFPGAKFKSTPPELTLPNGAVLRLRSLEKEHDYTKYLGPSYTWIGWDELGEYPSMTGYHRLKSRLRSPEGAKGLRIRATGNPGGQCHVDIAEYWGIDEHPEGSHLITDPKTRMTRMFLKSRLEDNRILMNSDPDYAYRLEGVGDPELVRAWREGDWTALAGTYFGSIWRREEIEVDSFEIPASWTLFASMDYGTTNPTACGLYAVDYDDIIYRITGYYEGDKSDYEQARGVRDCIKGCRLTNGRMPSQIFADPSMWTKRRVSESQNKSPADIFAEHGLYLTPANNDRVNGWRLCRDILIHDKFKVFRGWNDNFMRHIPAMPRDEKNAEDVAKGGNDHEGDGWRYGIVHMYKPAAPQIKPNTQGTGQELLDMVEAMNNAKEGRYGG